VCGIAGIVVLDGAPPDPALLKQMTDSLRHRGPDAEGSYIDTRGKPSAAIGHRRLSIIDLSAAANQPVSNEDGSVQCVVNGEIYNYRALRTEIAARHHFRSAGDSEVVAHLYEDRGVDSIAALDGMFALAIWDGRKRQLLLARDALGKKPLYFWSDGRRFVFGSEIKALLASGVEAAFDESHLGEYLAYGYVPTPNTLFKGIRKLPPGSYMVVGPHGVGKPRRYWDLRFPQEKDVQPISLDAAATAVREWLNEAVYKRLVADVPIGVLLSGGVDSSAVAASASRLVSGPLRTFTIGFEGPAFFDERVHARRVAEHLGAQHHEFLVRPDAAALVERLLYHYDEPFGDSSALPTYIVAREARQHVKVVLNGDGGDEVFAGYGQFRAALLADRVPAVLRAALGRLAAFIPPWGSQHGLVRVVRRFLVKAARPLDERIFSWSNYADLPAIARLAGPGLANRDQILRSYRAALAECGAVSLLSQLLSVSVRTFLLDDLLPKMDRMTMAHGLEARSPLLDCDLVSRASALPDRVKRKGGRSKRVLKRAVEAWLPPGALDRPKHGFGVPIGAWFRTDLRDMAEATLLDNPRLGALLPKENLAALFREHGSGRSDRGSQLWLLLTLELWLRKHRLP
jgi:asparagine synthase (glutamine-hydrolysing)